ncbi:MAG: HEAT repeat domain-containing protein [Planctomycetes bacterium]|nr:HEAT repeat domain-containing protein [Planctomycetota bacterium]
MSRTRHRRADWRGLAGLAVLLVAAAGAPAQPIPLPGVSLPEGRLQGLGRYVRPLRSGGGLAESRGAAWQVWWELNKEHYLGLARRDRMPGRGETGEGEPFVGARRPPDPAARPFGADARVRLVRPDLELLLREDKTLVRVAAALALGQLGDPRSAGALLDAVGDSNADVQDAAVLALGMVGDPDGVRALEELLGKTANGARLVRQSQVNDRLRATAALALGLTGRADALFGLAAATDRTEPRDVRAAAVLGIGLLDGEGGDSHLVEVLERKNSGAQIRAAAAIALGHTGGELARPALLSALRSTNTEVRRAAALALGNLVFPRPEAARLAQARARRREAKDAAPEALARMDAFLATLEAAAAREANEAERFDAARGRALRIAAAEDAEQGVRQFAAIALGQTGGPEERGFLVALLEDRLLELRPFAGLALGILGGRGADDDGRAATVLLREFRAASRLDHRVAFAVALGLRGWRGAGEPILAEMERVTDPLSRSYHAVALAMLGHTEALGAVVKVMLEARERDELQQSAMAYGLLATAQSTEMLAERLARSRDRFERKQAAVGLALFGRSSDLRALSRYLRDTSQPASDRAFVIEGLGMAGDVRDPGPLARLAGAYSFHLGFEAIERALQRKW